VKLNIDFARAGLFPVTEKRQRSAAQRKGRARNLRSYSRSALQKL